MKSPAVKRLNFAIAEDLMDSMNAGNSYSAELRKLYKDLDAHLMFTMGIQHQVLQISNLRLHLGQRFLWPRRWS